MQQSIRSPGTPLHQLKIKRTGIKIIQSANTFESGRVQTLTYNCKHVHLSLLKAASMPAEGEGTNSGPFCQTLQSASEVFLLHQS